MKIKQQKPFTYLVDSKLFDRVCYHLYEHYDENILTISCMLDIPLVKANQIAFKALRYKLEELES
jgi:hypothetical protein